jgi:hypothetical protein
VLLVQEVQQHLHVLAAQNLASLDWIPLLQLCEKERCAAMTRA